MNRVLIGIDDTDNKESRGTGFKSRQLGKLIEDEGLGSVSGITRHQLFFDPRIPYTSQNSSACLDIQGAELSRIISFSQTFLIRESAPGSDAGLAVAIFDDISPLICEWGVRAKKEVLTQKEALDLVHNTGVYLEGLTGTRDGIIGSLAAIGLRKSGNDGRFIWLKGMELRDLAGVVQVSDLFQMIDLDSIEDLNGVKVPADDLINLGDWLRPILIKDRAILIAEKPNEEQNEWKVATKEHIKSISN